MGVKSACLFISPEGILSAAVEKMKLVNLNERKSVSVPERRIRI